MSVSKHPRMDEMMRVLVADGHSEGRDTLAKALSRLGCAVYTAADGAGAVSATCSLLPEAVVLSLALSVRDGFAVLDALAGTPLPRYPAIIVVTAMGKDACARALTAGADAALEKPADPAALYALLTELTGHGPSKLALGRANLCTEAIAQKLREIGVPENLKGFSYLRRAVALVFVCDRLLRQATSRLYPLIAEEYGVSDHSVERAIRHAIETTWTRGRVDALHRIFGNSIDPQRGKPTNTECIAMLAQQLREQFTMEG